MNTKTLGRTLNKPESEFGLFAMYGQAGVVSGVGVSGLVVGNLPEPSPDRRRVVWQRTDASVSQSTVV